MSETSEAFLARALESLNGARSEFSNGRYNNTVNRSYYAAYQAAIAALEAAGIRPPSGKLEWSHSLVQAQFAGQLVGRRKLYPAGLRDTLSTLIRVRRQGDYEAIPITGVQAARALSRAQSFVPTISTRLRRGTV